MINLAEIAQDLMLEPDEIKEILEAYFEETEILFDDAKNNLQSNNIAELNKTIHAIKGASFNLRLNDIGELALRIEQDIKKGNINDIKGNLENLYLIFQEAKASI